MKQIVSENKNQNTNKFNKFIFSLLAAKIEKDRTEEEAEGFKGETKNLERIHRIIEHIMDSS